MPYADLVASDEYQSKYAGAALDIVIALATDPGNPIIGGTSGINVAEDFEMVPIEEAGNDGVDEYAIGRHTLSGTIPLFWSPEYNDNLLTRQNFVLKGEFIIFRRIAPGRPQEGENVDVFVGVVFNQQGSQQAARGALTMNLAFMAERRYSGEEWAALTGT